MRRRLSSLMAVAALAACGGEAFEAVEQGAEVGVIESALYEPRAVPSGFELKFVGWGDLPGDEVAVVDDHVNIDSLAVEGDELVMNLMHGGGCRRHDYGVKWSGALVGEGRSEVVLQLSHDGNEDGCRAILYSALRVPLKPVEEAYRSKHGASGGEVFVRVAEQDAGIVYRFGPAPR